eukprot:6484370-Amphidinium_carterae.2
MACRSAVRGYQDRGNQVAPRVGEARCVGTSPEEAAVLGGGARTGLTKRAKTINTPRPGPGRCREAVTRFPRAQRPGPVTDRQARRTCTNSLVKPCVAQLVETHVVAPDKTTATRTYEQREAQYTK